MIEHPHKVELLSKFRRNQAKQLVSEGASTEEVGLRAPHAPSA